MYSKFPYSTSFKKCVALYACGFYYARFLSELSECMCPVYATTFLWISEIPKNENYIGIQHSNNIMRSSRVFNYSNASNCKL